MIEEVVLDGYNRAHGKAATYGAGCRCDSCKVAKSVAARHYRLLHKVHGKRIGRPPTGRQSATCHPDRANHSKGLCGPCYRIEYNRKFHLEKGWLLGIQRRYGLTKEGFTKLLIDQNGCCALCAKQFGRIYIDHDHQSGRVRGLLCQRCNIAVAGFQFLRDNPFIHRYLMTTKEEESKGLS